MQKAQRLAFLGISLKHSGHFLVLGSSGASFLDLLIRVFIGLTTKK